MSGTLSEGAVVQNRYRVVRHIGQGGMGSVYEAFDERLANRVALKQTLLKSDRMKRAFEREAQILARMRHIALPRVIDHFTDEGGQFLVMEFVPGEDLATLLEKQNEPFPIVRVLTWADQLLDALTYLHTQPVPVIHRDIKPQNLKLVPGDQIVLLDFGLAKGALSYHTQTTSGQSLFGYTPQYAPLEQIESTGTDERSDFYSLAATLYCMMTGAPPPGAMMRAGALVKGRPDPLRPAHEIFSDVPPAVSNVLLKAMAIDNESRPSSALDMRKQLRAARPTSLPPLPPLVERDDVHQTKFLPSEQTTLPDESSVGTDEDRTMISDALPNTSQRGARKGFVWLIAGGGVIGVMLLAALAWFASSYLIGQSAAQTTATETAAAAALNQEATTTAHAATTEAATVAAAKQQTATALSQAETATAFTVEQQTAATQTAEALQQAQAATAMATQLTAIAAEESTRVGLHLPPGALGTATSLYDPERERLVLDNGYDQNIVTIMGSGALRASHTEKGIERTWARDLDYAMSGYGYVLGDMEVLRQNTELFLQYVGMAGAEQGVVPEVINADGPVVNTPGQGAWDSMPNLIQAVYAYVAKTGDREFYRQHRESLQNVGIWIKGLDNDNNALPDEGNIYPYGYYNSINNNVMHTYALAKFYTAFNQLAELEDYTGFDGSEWSTYATKMRTAFHRPFSEGGYWKDEMAWPIAWRTAEGESIDILETFGVFEALRSGLIAPSDGARYDTLMDALAEQLPNLIDDPTPMRLTLEGYPEWVLREVVRGEPWKLNASSPWIVGIAAPAYAQANKRDAASTLMRAYADMVTKHEGRVVRLMAGANTPNGPGDDGGRGVAWDSAAWFLAVYGGHYGITMTPAALVVEPAPFETLPADGVTNLSYQGALVQLSLDAAQQTYHIQADRATLVVLRPLAGSSAVQVNGGTLQEEIRMVLQPGQEYDVVSSDKPIEPPAATPPDSLTGISNTHPGVQ
jgi:serine/threonine protein kinase